jgi:hypothetical protein
MLSLRRHGLILCALTALLSPACAAPPAASASSPSPNVSSSDVITEQELSDPSLAGSSALEAVRRLRPRFLNRRIAGLKESEDGPRLSVNGASPMALSELANIGISEVSEIRYLSVADAGLRFGLNSPMGPVLLVTLRRH